MSNRLQPFFTQLLTRSSWKLRLLRHGFLWITTILLIFQGFYFVSHSMPSYTTRNAIRYSLLATSLFGTLTIIAYILITNTIKKFVLTHFRIDLFLVTFFGIHVVTSEIVKLHFDVFIDIFSINNLPKIYRNYIDYISNITFWQAPFNPIIVWLFSFSLFYNYLLYAVGLKVFKDFFTTQYRQTELEKEILKLEFNFLKAQVSPHFLFNTLNNIYSFTITSPAKAGNAILKLAELMRYTLYETSEEWVLLTKEVTFLHSYVTLQRIRYDSHVAIRFRAVGHPSTQFVPPLLLIIFVENAFKHGIQSSMKDSWVDIYLEINPDTLVFSVDNSVPVTQASAGGGIGLYNARKRLAFLYSNNFQLSITSEQDSFSIKLTLPINE